MGFLKRLVTPKKKIEVATGKQKLQHKDILINNKLAVRNRIKELEGQVMFHIDKQKQLSEEIQSLRKELQKVNSEINAQ